MNEKAQNSVVEAKMALAVGIVFAVIWMASSCEAYQNHTVGGKAGWFFSDNAPATDYQKWADGQSFGVGDYLTFHTNSNHTVVQTYNVTTYNRCDYNDAEDDDTTLWSSVAPSENATRATVSVLLSMDVVNYFFSSSFEGIECKKGLKFKIKVAYGQGLPASLRHPPPPPPYVPQVSGSPPDAAPSLTIPTFNDTSFKSGSMRMSPVMSAAAFYGFVLLLSLGLPFV